MKTIQRPAWFERIKPLWLWLMLAVGLVGSVLAVLLLRDALIPLRALAPHDPVELQFAWSRAAAIEILRGYELLLPALFTSLVIDGFFPVCYGLLLLGAATLVRRGTPPGSWRRLGGAAMLFAGLAPVCDWLENAFTLQLITNLETVPGWAVFGLTLFAEIKWLLLLAVVVWLLGAVIVVIRRRRSVKIITDKA
ncbi:MAG: hypothetical protein GF399_07845 [Candidatus Coatesbacteria bacterium]|nr:hypothetical protein [Candidatus Coatesbacteria bacterium]